MRDVAQFRLGVAAAATRSHFLIAHPAADHPAVGAGTATVVEGIGMQLMLVCAPPASIMDVARVQRWCRARVPEHVRDEVRVEVEVDERCLTIVECRPPWRADFGPEWTRFLIARLRYTKATRLLVGAQHAPR